LLEGSNFNAKIGRLEYAQLFTGEILTNLLILNLYGKLESNQGFALEEIKGFR
jgi:hypothetical protein